MELAARELAAMGRGRRIRCGLHGLDVRFDQCLRSRRALASGMRRATRPARTTRRRIRTSGAHGEPLVSSAAGRHSTGAAVVRTPLRTPSLRALSPGAQAQVLAYLRDPRFVDRDLKVPVKGARYTLCVVLDLFSRFVVAWMLARRESATLAQRLIRTACAREGTVPGQLTTHSDRGSIQVAKDLHDLYQDLGIVRSLSRPRVSDDNPYSESLVKTTKYAPTYPDRFDGFAPAKAWCGPFFQDYNHEHKHEGIAWLTPATVHEGRAQTVLAQRQAVMDAAYQQHPERFVKGPPRVPHLPTEVWINQAEDQTAFVG